MQHQLRRFCFTSTRLAANHDRLISPRLLERREGVLGLLEAVGRQAAVGRVVVSSYNIVAVDGEPPACLLRDRRRRRGASLAAAPRRRDGGRAATPSTRRQTPSTPSTPSTRRSTLSRCRRREVVRRRWSLEGVHRDEDGARVRVDQIHAEAVLDVVEDRRLL